MRYNTKREANVGTQSTEAFLYTVTASIPTLRLRDPACMISTVCCSFTDGGSSSKHRSGKQEEQSVTYLRAANCAAVAIFLPSD